MSVTFATHCHSRDLPRLHAPGVLEELIDCHSFTFDEILIIHQRCNDLPYEFPFNIKNARVIDIPEEDYPSILEQFGIPHRDAALTSITHDWGWQWYYEHHCVNHCKEILESKCDYIVFNDADCRITHQPNSWVQKGIALLESDPRVFVVSPSDGGHEFSEKLTDGTRLTQTMSQQLFMGKTSRLREMNFSNLRWDGQFRAPYGPMQEFYGMFEGHVWRWIDKYNLYRAILPEQWRYWHGAYH